MPPLQGKTCPQVVHDYIITLNSLGFVREGSLGISPCSGKGEIIDWFCCVSNLQPSDYTQI